MQASSERLPWLTDEAPRTASPDRRPAPGARAMWPWYLLLLLLIAGVGAGAWWLGTAQRKAPRSELPAEQSLPIPVTRDPPTASEPFVSDPAPPEVEVADAPAQPVRRAPAPVARAAPPVFNEARPADVDDAMPASRGVFPADEPASDPPLTGPSPVVVTRAQQPYRGQVVQLGAFPTRAQANDSWRQITRRYPYLATKPKMVNTVDVRGLGGGRPTRMYRLQLGTSSQAQSVVICQQLERAGHSCVVVY